MDFFGAPVAILMVLWVCLPHWLAAMECCLQVTLSILLLQCSSFCQHDLPWTFPSSNNDINLPRLERGLPIRGTRCAVFQQGT